MNILSLNHNSATGTNIKAKYKGKANVTHSEIQQQRIVQKNAHVNIASYKLSNNELNSKAIPGTLWHIVGQYFPV